MSIELSKVFYNLIPGAIYTVLWAYLYADGFENIRTASGKAGLDMNSTIVYILFVIISVFLGYLLNAIWRIVRKHIRAENCAKDYGGKLKNLDLEVIHQHHSLLWYKGKEALSEHFSAIAAMWGNIFVGSALTIVFFSFFGFDKAIFISQLILLPLSYHFFIEFKHASYSSIWRQSVEIKKGKTDE
jgi:hypothetical protein